MGEHPDLENLEEERILEEIQIVKRDSAGYVETVQIGAETYSGDAVRYALGVPVASFFPRGRRGRNPLCYLWARGMVTGCRSTGRDSCGEGAARKKF